MSTLTGVISVLSQEEMQSVHDGALEILERAGLWIDHEGAVDYLDAAGCRVDREQKRVWLPRKLVQKAVDTMRTSFELEPSRGNREPMSFGSQNMYFATMPRVVHHDFRINCGAFPPNVLDLDGNRRYATLQDVRDSIRLADALEHIDFVGPPCSAQEIPHELRPVTVTAELVKNTSKPGGIELWDTTQIEYISQIAAVVRGGEEELKKRPLLVGYCGIRSPLCLDRNMADIFIDNIKRGFPQWLYSMPCAGTTAPATMLGVLTQGIAESLVGLVLGYAIDPEATVSIEVICGMADMKSASFPYSGPDVILMAAATNQMVADFYKRPGGAHGGRTDACLSGVQAGIEKGLSMLFPLMVGAVGVGTLGQIEKNMTFSFRQLVIDDEIVRYIKHILRGVRGEPDRRAVDIIVEVGPGGHFTDHEHTVAHFREEFWF
ncbi:MAG: trimethylamine methyltransferase family protein, partial [Candidatus Latescibacteria bacterium]|nr:trimethylamine methyltransferase family protein [Candidatus Latescibacterota bacterium]